MPSLLETIAFRQPRRAQGEIADLAGGLPSCTQAQIEALLASSADPDAAAPLSGRTETPTSRRF